MKRNLITFPFGRYVILLPFNWLCLPNTNYYPDLCSTFPSRHRYPIKSPLPFATMASVHHPIIPVGRTFSQTPPPPIDPTSPPLASLSNPVHPCRSRAAPAASATLAELTHSSQSRSPARPARVWYRPALRPIWVGVGACSHVSDIIRFPGSVFCLVAFLHMRCQLSRFAPRCSVASPHVAAGLLTCYHSAMPPFRVHCC